LKTILISSALSLAIGFTFGWLIKSASADLDSFVPQTGQNTPTPRPPAPTRTPDAPPERVLPERPSSDGPTHAPPIGTATVPGEPTRADRAKWMRLIEVLGLNPDQAKALEAAIAESLPKLETGKSPEISYTEAGALLEKNILALLNADQRKAFADMQRRAMDNRIELSAQQTYMQELGELDLMPEQRALALDLLRDRAKQLSADIPSSARLLLTGAFLPVSERNFSEDAIRLLRQLSPQYSGDAALDKLAEKRRVEAEEKAQLFEEVLTPAQLELYRSRLSQSAEILDQIRSGE
jgi:hypothetical protein